MKRRTFLQLIGLTSSHFPLDLSDKILYYVPSIAQGAYYVR
jgi:hypothetical protein